MDCSIYIKRKTDGKVARVDICNVSVHDTLWDTLKQRTPMTAKILDPTMILGHVEVGMMEPFIDRIFDVPDDEDVADWLTEYEARVVLFDKDTGLPLTTLRTFRRYNKEIAVSIARDYATGYVESSGKDTSMMDVRVFVGDSLEWKWEE